MRTFYLITLTLLVLLSSCHKQHICPAYRTGGTGSWMPSGGSYNPLLARELIKPRAVLKNDSIFAAQQFQEQADSLFEISQVIPSDFVDSNFQNQIIKTGNPPNRDLVRNTTVTSTTVRPGGSGWGYSSGGSSVGGGFSGGGGTRKKRNEWAIDLIEKKEVIIYGRDSLPVINQTVEIKNHKGIVIWITTTDSSGIAKLAGGFIGDCSSPPSDPNEPEDSVMLHVPGTKYYMDTLITDTIFVDSIFYDTVFAVNQIIGSIDTTFIHYEEIVNGQMFQTRYKDSVYIEFDSLTGTETHYSVRTETTDTINADNEEIITDIKYYNDSTHSTFFIESSIDLYNVLITNSSGGTYKRFNLPAQQIVDLRMENLPKGVYFLQYKTLTGRKVRGKMIKRE